MICGKLKSVLEDNALCGSFKDEGSGGIITEIGETIFNGDRVIDTGIVLNDIKDKDWTIEFVYSPISAPNDAFMPYFGTVTRDAGSTLGLEFFSYGSGSYRGTFWYYVYGTQNDVVNASYKDLDYARVVLTHSAGDSYVNFKGYNKEGTQIGFERNLNLYKSAFNYSIVVGGVRNTDSTFKYGKYKLIKFKATGVN